MVFLFGPILPIGLLWRRLAFLGGDLSDKQLAHEVVAHVVVLYSVGGGYLVSDQLGRDSHTRLLHLCLQRRKPACIAVVLDIHLCHVLKKRRAAEYCPAGWLSVLAEPHLDIVDRNERVRHVVDQVLNEARVLPLLERDQLVEILETEEAALCLNLLARGRYDVRT